MQKNSTIPASKNIVIDVVSDFACPWCYVGFMRLQNAIDQFKGTWTTIAVAGEGR